jgi:ribose 5-phosphate isomerase B
MDESRAMELIDIFLSTEFAGGRHARRVAKIAQLEQPQ